MELTGGGMLPTGLHCLVLQYIFLAFKDAFPPPPHPTQASHYADEASNTGSEVDGLVCRIYQALNT